MRKDIEKEYKFIEIGMQLKCCGNREKERILQKCYSICKRIVT